MTAAVFFVLPRSAQAAFRNLVPERYHLAGLSSEVILGEIGEIQQSTTALMHVRIPGVEDVRGFRWRGNALADFDGKRWFNRDVTLETLRVRDGQVTVADDEQRRRAGRRLNYEVRLQPVAADVLFIAGSPEFLRLDSPLVIRTQQDSYRLGFRSQQILRYGVYAFVDRGLQNPPSPYLPPEERQAYLRLPDLDPRIGALARQVTDAYPSAAEKAAALEYYLAHAYGYTLDLPEDEVADPIADFLFVREQGHCEYFASAMAVMLRGVGIPSRVATGFLGGLYNPISGWHVVRASDAHSWVEAWLPERGWVTFDPTPPSTAAAGIGVWTRLGLVADAAEVFWREWVISYDPGRRRTLAARVDEARRALSVDWDGDWRERWSAFGQSVLTWLREHATLLAVFVALMILVIQRTRLRLWIVSWRCRSRLERGDAEASDATVLYRRALVILRRRGIEKPSWLTPLEFAQAVPSQRLGAVLIDLAHAYNDLRFGGRQDAAARMLSLLDRLKSVER